MPDPFMGDYKRAKVLHSSQQHLTREAGDDLSIIRNSREVANEAMAKVDSLFWPIDVTVCTVPYGTSGRKDGQP